MKKLRTVNEFHGVISGENTVDFCGGTFEFAGATDLEKGTPVKIRVPFDAVELTDDEQDGTIGGNVTQTLYKGSYYQVQVYSDTDEDFYTDTPDEWDMGVGIKVDPEKIAFEKIEEADEDEEK